MTTIAEKDPIEIGRIVNKPEEEEQPQDVGKIVQRPETGGEKFIRTATQWGARGAETAAGFLGDIQATVQAPGKALEKKVEEKYKEKTGKELPQLKKGIGIGDVKFATRQDVREDVTRKIFGDYTEPKADWEKEGGELVSNVIGWMIAGPRESAGQALSWLQRLGKAGWVSSAGSAVMSAAKALGAPVGVQEGLRIGTMMIAGGINRGEAERYKDALYREARRLEPSRAIVPVGPIQTRIADIRSNLQLGISTTTKRAIEPALADLERKVAAGSLTLEDLRTTRSNLMEEMYALRTAGVPLERYENIFTQLVSAVDEALAPIEAQFPEWAGYYRAANDANRGLETAGVVTENFERASARLNLDPNTRAMLQVMNSGWKKIGRALTYPFSKAHEVIIRLQESPVLRHYYLQATTNAARGNIAATASSLQKFDEAAQKEDKRKKAKKFVPSEK